MGTSMENLSSTASATTTNIERTTLRSQQQRNLRNYNSFDETFDEWVQNELKPSNGTVAAVAVTTGDSDIKILSASGPAGVEAPTSLLLHVHAVDHRVAKDYNPHDFGNTDNPTSFWGTVSHLIILSFGPAVLTIPRTFQNCGYVTAFFVSFATVFLYAYNMHMLVWSEYKLCKVKRIPNMSYADVLYHSIKEGPPVGRWLAPYARITAYTVFMTVWFGCTAITLLLMSQNFVIIYKELFDRVVTDRTVMLALFLPIWLLCCIRRLSYLVPFSMLATAINFLSILVVMYYLTVGPWSSTAQKFGSVAGIPLTAGAVLFNLTATGIMMPLKNEMRDPRRFNSGLGVLTVSYVPVSLLYALLGISCSIKYGDTLEPSVIQNLPAKEFLSQATLISSTITSALVYPLASYIVFDVMWNNILKEKRENLSHPLWWEYVVRTAVVFVSFLGAYTVPNISLFLSLSGTVGTSIDSIIFPALMQTLVMWNATKNRAKFKRSLVKNLLIIGVALVLMITGTVNCVADIIASYDASGVVQNNLFASSL